MSQSDEKVYKAIDENEVSEKVNKIVDQLVMQEGSREAVNEIIKDLKEEYGLHPTVIRQTASIIHKHNKVSYNLILVSGLTILHQQV
jgi:polyhydroxyalkanoate synthesis regulator phasin